MRCRLASVNTDVHDGNRRPPADRGIARSRHRRPEETRRRHGVLLALGPFGAAVRCMRTWGISAVRPSASPGSRSCSRRGPEPLLPAGSAFDSLAARRDGDACHRRRVTGPHLRWVFVDATVRAAPRPPPRLARPHVAGGARADLHPGGEHGVDDRLLAPRPRLRVVECPWRGIRRRRHRDDGHHDHVVLRHRAPAVALVGSTGRHADGNVPRGRPRVLRSEYHQDRRWWLGAARDRRQRLPPHDHLASGDRPPSRVPVARRGSHGPFPRRGAADAAAARARHGGVPDARHRRRVARSATPSQASESDDGTALGAPRAWSGDDGRDDSRQDSARVRRDGRSGSSGKRGLGRHRPVGSFSRGPPEVFDGLFGALGCYASATLTERDPAQGGTYADFPPLPPVTTRRTSSALSARRGSSSLVGPERGCTLRTRS